MMTPDDDNDDDERDADHIEAVARRVGIFLLVLWTAVAAIIGANLTGCAHLPEAIWRMERNYYWNRAEGP